MSKGLLNRTCDICGKEKPCSNVSFHPVGEDKAAPSPYTGTHGMPVVNEFYLNCCEDCGREQGTVSKTPWMLVLIGYVLLFGSIILVSLPKNATGLEPSSAWPVIPMMIGWALTVFAPMALIFKLRNECTGGAMMGLIFLQFIPVAGLIGLLFNAKRINRNYRAVSALKPVADRFMGLKKEKDEEMARLAENEAVLTEEQKKQVAEYRQEKEKQEKEAEYNREIQQEKVNRSNYRGAIIGIIFTVVLAFVGISTYSSGRGYMTFLGMELSPGGFAGLIGAFLVWDVISIVSAKKKM